MFTLGDFVDRLSILERRIRSLDKKFSEEEKKATDCYPTKEACSIKSILIELIEQRAYLIQEIGVLLRDIFEQRRPPCFKKYKLYDQDVKVQFPTSFLEAVGLLVAQNSLQWDLESARREAADLEEIVKIQNRIGESNKKRNDYIDAIDMYVEEAVKIIARDRMRLEGKIIK